MTNTNFENRTLTNRASAQMPPAKRPSAPEQAISPDWRQKHQLLQMILNFAQPILLQLAEKRNVHLSVTRSQDQTSWNFSFQEDNFSE